MTIAISRKERFCSIHLHAPVYVFLILLLCRPLGSHAGFNPRRLVVSATYPVKYRDWQSGFLSGNGKMGIIVFGNPLNETVIYNDRKFNLAKTGDRSFAQVSPSDLAKIKSYCAGGNFAEANKLAVSSAQYKGGGEGNKHPGYEMLISIPSAGTVTNYSRTCNFRTGEITVRWSDNRGAWVRKSFVSRKDNVVIQYLTAPDKGKLTCAVQLATDPEMLFPEGMSFINSSDAGFLNMRAKYPNGTPGAGYEGVTRVIVSGGSEKMDGNVLHVTDARSVMLLTRTDKYYEDCESQWDKKILQKQLEQIPADYNRLLEGQIATHGAIYDRVHLDLNAGSADRERSNEDLLAGQKQSSLPVSALWERIFDAGRYYFLSSGSETAPPDLLGIWTGDCNAGWGGYYHLDANLNLQIAGGNIGNMPEAMEGYFKLNEDWRPDFALNAQKLLGYLGLLACGNTPGPTTGLMANINDYYPYQYATGEEPWLLYPFWEHYLVTGDRKFLKDRLYPLLKEMGYFYEDFLSHEDANGHYIFAGSVSPENQPSNLKVSLLNNSAFDISGAKFALTALVRACKVLGLESGAGEGVERWTRILDKIPPYLINADGALQEWAWPGLKDNYNHRHSSQLLMVWPYGEVTPENAPVFFGAAAKTLERKDAFNYENAGHGLLHSALIATGLKNNVSVYSKLMRLFKEDFYYNNLCTSHYGEHGVFCTDVCNAVPAIMMEMLISSAPGVLELLPALPPELEKGEISGVKGRNRVTVQTLKWDLKGNFLQCVLRSDIDQNITLIERRGIHSIRTGASVKPSSLGEIARIIHLKQGVETSVAIKLR